jgi:hypothetical protein
MRTSELTGAALDWAVAKCEGHTDSKDFAWYYDRRNTFNFSTNWAQGGPIIEREGIELTCTDEWKAFMPFQSNPCDEDGPTPLIAAMRCYVASKLGDDMEIPNELTGDNK